MPKNIVLATTIIVLAITIGTIVIFSRSDSDREEISTDTNNTTPSLTPDIYAQEIEKLQQEVNALKNKKPQVIIKEQPQNSPVVIPANITADDLKPFLTGVVKISCGSIQNGNLSYGSGTLFKSSKTGPAVLTNDHVINSSDCFVSVGDLGEDIVELYELNTANAFEFNSVTDSQIVSIKEPSTKSVTGEPIKVTPLTDLNYSVINQNLWCPTEMSIGSPIVVIGYPAFSQKVTKYRIPGTNIEVPAENAPRTTTNGIVSAYEQSNSAPYFGSLPYKNYFVSAKIDSGNSGGIAFSKDPQKGLCVLGIPTWLQAGNYETQGIIQNIHNIFYSSQ